MRVRGMVMMQSIKSETARLTTKTFLAVRMEGTRATTKRTIRLPTEPTTIMTEYMAINSCRQGGAIRDCKTEKGSFIFRISRKEIGCLPYFFTFLERIHLLSLA